ncbi:MAG: DUF368 domain-containing protein [Bacteroidales bacterium]|nr:DUF368 domain-containing protein [Bacteroidales bacterium]
MGAADVIPGVSGGTIAFIMGIYGELLNSIKSINGEAFRLFFSGKFAPFWKHVNGTFLASLFAGILISVFSLARLMKYLLEFHPIPLWSFFFGLILASAVYILKGLDKWNIQNIISLLVGVATGAFICLASPGQTPDELWFIFLSGAIAICAMVLPGISGSFILLLLGKYAFVMTAVSELNIPVLIVFAAGCAVGIVGFSHFLSWLLKKFYMLTIALLSGFMLGSLLKVWPWKIPGAADGFDYPALPGTFTQVTGLESQLGTSIAFAVLGLVLVLAIEFFAVKEQK